MGQERLEQNVAWGYSSKCWDYRWKSYGKIKYANKQGDHLVYVV